MNTGIGELVAQLRPNCTISAKYGLSNPSYITESEDQGWDGCNFQDRLFQPLTHPSMRASHFLYTIIAAEISSLRRSGVSSLTLPIVKR